MGFINRKKDLNNLPADCMLGFFDIVRFYRRFPHEEGMSTLSFRK